MTADEFNALPLEARAYIEKQKTCLSCGKANDLDAHYRNYLIMENGSLYTLRMGAVPFKNKDGEGEILYPIYPTDSEEVVKVKLAQALAVNAVAPDKFEVISIEKIEKILGATKTLKGAAKASADKKAADDAAKVEAPESSEEHADLN